ncbi:MAG TPA: NAD(P)-binding domain-containing protein [Thermoanaerobaculia bacterium]|jgi:predicted dinucleotide-binding enzyme|nr:NAD(P)-binding domain-containing protein [Thermoanaerobaculia bacterium]
MHIIKVGILGSGDVGKALARGFLGLGHEVRIGSREPEKLREWAAAAGERASSGTFAETAEFGDVIVLATLGTGTESAVDLAGQQHFDGKVVIDATNPLDFSAGMPPRLFVGHTDSLGERMQRRLPKARVVKAFNTVGNALMVNPDLAGGPPDMFIAGDDEDAKKIVSQICHHFGWGVADIGGIEGSRHLEPMCMVWVLYGAKTGGWSHAFKLLKK